VKSLGVFMPELSDVSEKEISDNIIAIIEQLPGLLSKVSMGELELQFSGKNKEEMREQLPEKLNKCMQVVTQIEAIQIETIPEKEKILRSYQLINELFHLTNTIPPEQDWLDFFIDKLGPVLIIPKDLSYLQNTKYLEYISAMNKLGMKLYHKGKYPLVKSFFSNISFTEDEYIIFQDFFNCTINHYRNLQKGQQYISKLWTLLLPAHRRAVNKSQINKHIEIYFDLSGHYEKYLRILVGLLEILNDKTPDVSKIRRSLSENHKNIDKKCKILTEDFNVHIRNSIAHRSFFLDQASESIEFKDKRVKIQISYSDFSNKVKELSALVLALFLM
jgi:hypothetical protein